MYPIKLALLDIRRAKYELSRRLKSDSPEPLLVQTGCFWKPHEVRIPDRLSGYFIEKHHDYMWAEARRTKDGLYGVIEVTIRSDLRSFNGLLGQELRPLGLMSPSTMSYIYEFEDACETLEQWENTRLEECDENKCSLARKPKFTPLFYQKYRT